MQNLDLSGSCFAGENFPFVTFLLRPANLNQCPPNCQGPSQNVAPRDIPRQGVTRFPKRCGTKDPFKLWPRPRSCALRRQMGPLAHRGRGCGAECGKMWRVFPGAAQRSERCAQIREPPSSWIGRGCCSCDDVVILLDPSPPGSVSGGTAATELRCALLAGQIWRNLAL